MTSKEMFDRYFLKFYLIILTISNASCQNLLNTISISGSISDVRSPKEKIYLRSYIGNEITEIDSSLINDKGDFKFQNIKFLNPGLYSLGFRDYTADFAINDNEKIIEIFTSAEELSYQQINIKNSVEHEAFMELKTLHVYYLMTQDSVNELFEHGIESASLENYFFNYKKQYNTTLKKIRSKYPYTYTGEVMVPVFYIPLMQTDEMNVNRYKNDDQYNFHHYFDQIDFSNKNTVNNPFYTEKIFTYFSTYVNEDLESITSGIDILMNKIKQSEPAKEVTLHFILDEYAKMGDYDVTEYILDRYYDKKYNNETGKYYNKIAEVNKKLKPGNIAPDLVFNGTEKQIKLSEIKNQKAVLIFFWSGECDNCKSLLPKLTSLYNQYQSDGFEIFAVSVDTDKKLINSVIDSYNLKWINVYDLKGWSSSSSTLY
jgi:thiol-disulfide isomerase/thioredoxin